MRRRTAWRRLCWAWRCRAWTCEWWGVRGCARGSTFDLEVCGTFDRPMLISNGFGCTEPPPFTARLAPIFVPSERVCLVRRGCAPRGVFRGGDADGAALPGGSSRTRFALGRRSGSGLISACGLSVDSFSEWRRNDDGHILHVCGSCTARMLIGTIAAWVSTRPNQDEA